MKPADSDFSYWPIDASIVGNLKKESRNRKLAIAIFLFYILFL